MKLILKLIDRLRRKIPRGRVYYKQNYTGWGNSIVWSKWPELKVHGHLGRRPEVGDILVDEFQKLGLLEFQFVHIEYCRDPNDMFFASLKYLGPHIEDSLTKV